MNEKKTVLYGLDDNPDERLRMEFVTDKGKVMDLVVQYESFFDNVWNPIVRYDCSHGYFHRDTMKKDGIKRKKEIKVSNLNEALNYALVDIKINWESYKENYCN
ncbi:MAG: hypothetical protein M3R36_11430 [Bacteroidota bacterium]|nr:hypothetical protein [Bacteroidota bacterium]